MDRDRRTGQVLQAQRRLLAEGTVARQYQRQPELKSRYGPGGQEKCVQDTEYHLSFLASAVTYSSPRLFSEYIAWAKALMLAYGVELVDVERNLLCLWEVLQEQLAPEMAESVRPSLDAALNTLHIGDTVPETYLQGTDKVAELAQDYLHTLLRADRYEAVRIVMDAVKSGVPLRDIYLGVFQACQREIGRLWQLKQITVAQEHYCTATTQLAMAQLYPYLFAQPRNGRRLVAASVGGELHEVGLRIVTDFFELNGWETVYLGANVPHSSILKTVADQRPDLLLVSATMTFHLSAVEELITRLRAAAAGQLTKVLVGGYPCLIDSEVWRKLGADACACDAAEALAVAEQLVESEPEPRSGGFNPTWTTAVERSGPKFSGDAAMYNELARVNNELVTAQRELARKNAELERLNVQLAAADTSKDRFLATLAHELRNPLAPLRSGLEILRLAPGDATLADEVRGMMERQTEHLMRLVDDLLDVSRITSGKLKLQKSKVDLANVVRSAIELAESMINQRGHQLSVTLPQDHCIVEADPTRLAQVVTNLLTNAARYTRPGGNIWLTVQCQDNEAVIRVLDTGIGIPPDMLQRIFVMFAQVDRQMERTQGGLGIGLMLVKRLIEMHGGVVEVRSEGEGKGSEFIVRLPMRSESTEVANTSL